MGNDGNDGNVNWEILGDEMQMLHVGSILRGSSNLVDYIPGSRLAGQVVSINFFLGHKILNYHSHPHS